MTAATQTTDRASWLEWRRGGIGASEVAALVPALRPSWASPWTVWGSKVGLIPDDDDPAPHMQFGLDLEPVIARWFNRETGLHVVGAQTWLSHPSLDWARATIDGYVVEHELADVTHAIGLFESKYTAEAPWAEVPDHYAAQVQWGMFVGGFTHAWIGSMHLPFGRPRFKVYEIERDEKDIALLAEAAESFWRDHVLTGVAPEVDDSEATAQALRAIYPPRLADDDSPEVSVALDDLFDVLRERDELGVHHTWIERRQRHVDSLIRARLGDAEVGTLDGEPLLTYRTVHRKGYKPKPVEPTSYRVLKPASKADREAS
jgi:putative phage-type endonuclease